MAKKTLYTVMLESLYYLSALRIWACVLCLLSQLQLKETSERILAVDRAAAMIEEMMKQKTNSQVGLVGSQTVKVDSVVSHFFFFFLLMRWGKQ